MAENLNLNGLLFTQSLASTAHGFWVAASLLTAIPMLFVLDEFSDPNLQPDNPGIYAIVETCLACASFLVALVGSFTVLASKNRQTTPLTQYTLGVYYVISFIICVIITGIRLNKMGILADLGMADETGTCRDSSWTGNPIARLNLAGYEVETITDCQFNVYDPNLVNINRFGNGTNNPILVDWSSIFNYDAANRGILAQAAQSAGEDVDAAAMPLMHEFWYWGCNTVCHPRHRLNYAWLAYSITNVGIYLLLLIVSFAAAVEANRNEKLATNSKKTDIEKGNTSQTKASSPEDEDEDEDEDDEDEAPDAEGWRKRRSWSSMRF